MGRFCPSKLHFFFAKWRFVGALGSPFRTGNSNRYNPAITILLCDIAQALFGRNYLGNLPLRQPLHRVHFTQKLVLRKVRQQADWICAGIAIIAAPMFVKQVELASGCCNYVLSTSVTVIESIVLQLEHVYAWR